MILKGAFIVSCLVALPTLATDPFPGQRKSYEGAVEIRRDATDQTALIIAVDESRGGRRDGAADVAFVFYSESQAPDVRFVAERAHIEIQNDSNLLVILSGEQRLTFANRGETPTGEARKGIFFGDAIGLARYWGDNVSRLRVNGPITAAVGCDGPDSGPCYSDWSLGGGGGGTKCDAGGCPAPSCSATGPGSTSCSVSNCPAGYCACCNYGGAMTYASCKCIKG